jgi:hypothetical protein
MKIINSLILFILVTSSFAQLSVQNNVFATAGSSFSNGTTVIDFTFGETFTTILPLESNYIFTQGFQQPISVQSGISLDEFLNDGFEVYPNPFRGELEMKIPDNYALEMLLFDNSGRIVYESFLSAVETTIDLSKLANGNYQLVLKKEEKVIGNLTLIKSY